MILRYASALLPPLAAVVSDSSAAMPFDTPEATPRCHVSAGAAAADIFATPC
jgi:hypothetical protein